MFKGNVRMSQLMQFESETQKTVAKALVDGISNVPTEFSCGQIGFG